MPNFKDPIATTLFIENSCLRWNHEKEIAAPKSYVLELASIAIHMLRHLDLSDLKDLTNDELYRILSCDNKITRLLLTDCFELTVDALPYIIKHCPLLTELDFENVIVNSTISTFMDFFADCTMLSQLMISSICLEDNSDREQLMKIGDYCPNLSVFHPPLQYFNALALANILLKCPLTSLRCIEAGNWLDDTAIPDHFDEPLKLQTLILVPQYEAVLSDGALARLISNCPDLIYLDLDMQQNIGAATFNAIANCNQLQELHLNFCVNLTDDVLINITKCCPCLVNLQISGIDNLTKFGILHAILHSQNLIELGLGTTCRTLGYEGLKEIAIVCTRLQTIVGDDYFTQEDQKIINEINQFKEEYPSIEWS